VNQTQAHIFLLEPAQESHIGISSLLDLDSHPNHEKAFLKTKTSSLMRLIFIFFGKVDKLNFRVKYYFLLIVELHTYI